MHRVRRDQARVNKLSIHDTLAALQGVLHAQRDLLNRTTKVLARTTHFHILKENFIDSATFPIELPMYHSIIRLCLSDAHNACVCV